MMHNTTNPRPQMAIVQNHNSPLLPITASTAKTKVNPSAKMYVATRNSFTKKRYSFDDNGGGYRGL